MNWLRRLFCDHNWQERTRSVVSPILYGLHEIKFTDRHKYIVGFATIVFECALCKKHKTVELLGEIHQPAKPATLHAIRPRGPHAS